MKVLDDDTDEHVEHEEADQQQKRDEVDQAPLAVILDRLAIQTQKVCQSIFSILILKFLLSRQNLLVDPNGVQPSVHDVDPAVFG